MTNTTENLSCLCRAVKLTTSLKNSEIQSCHCKQCQIWTGGGPLFVVAVDDLHIEGEENILKYHASAHGERGFCKHCGTTLYWSMKDRAPRSLAIGLFPDQSTLQVSEELFVDYRPEWFPVFDKAKQSPEHEQMALLNEYLKKNS